RSRVPSASDQPTVRTAGRELRVDVDRLRIEPPRELEHVVRADAHIPVLVHRPGVVVIEPPLPDPDPEISPQRPSLHTPMISIAGSLFPVDLPTMADQDHDHDHDGRKAVPV